jgi:hypothetical protein
MTKTFTEKKQKEKVLDWIGLHLGINSTYSFPIDFECCTLTWVFVLLLLALPTTTKARRIYCVQIHYRVYSSLKDFSRPLGNNNNRSIIIFYEDF